MKRVSPLAAFVIAFGAVVMATGCSTQPPVTQHSRTRVEIFGNAPQFDSYVNRRTEDLLQMGVAKDRSEAASLARSHAERRYGGRGSAYETSWRIGGGNRKLKASEIDDARAKAAGK